MTGPVLFIVFRRPEQTRRVFEAIAAARPARLFVAADGPRNDAERAACAETRAIATAVTWPCELLTDFSETNQGLRDRETSAMQWFFRTVDEGIVLEDDTLPTPDFFRFMEAMLDRYRDDRRVMMISGETYQRRRPPFSYSFSKYPLTWGWASWRRAWAFFDPDLKAWPSFRDSPEASALWDSRDEREYFTSIFQRTFDGQLRNTWDYAWWYACMTQGLTIRPAVNLVANIGGGALATHTVDHAAVIDRPVGGLDDPLRHPPFVVRDRDGDLDTWDVRFPGGVLKHQRTLRHHVTRPLRWLRRKTGL